MSVTAILTAGGTGSRMKSRIPKQFMTVNEIPIIIYTLQKFQNSRHIDNIVIACLPEWQPMLRAYSVEFNISKLRGIIDGGSTGIESIKNCFETIEKDTNEDVVVIHDGNRPLISDDIIEDNIITARRRGATTTFTDIHDGVVSVKGGAIIDSGLKRESIKSTQTPHSFKYSVLSELFRDVDGDADYISLADAALKKGFDIGMVRGSELNFKITTSSDLVMFEAIINARISSAKQR